MTRKRCYGLWRRLGVWPVECQRAIQTTQNRQSASLKNSAPRQTGRRTELVFSDRLKSCQINGLSHEYDIPRRAFKVCAFTPLLELLIEPMARRRNGVPQRLKQPAQTRFAATAGQHRNADLEGQRTVHQLGAFLALPPLKALPKTSAIATLRKDETTKGRSFT